MGVYFANYAGWNILHFGKLWSLFQKDYPKGDILPPILDPRKFVQGDLEFSQLPFRAMFTDLSDNQLVQVQSSAFLRNWRKTAANQAYTHYADLKPKFEADWRKFSAFLEENGFPRPQVFQCEVTYVNHLVRGVEWHSYNDLAKLIKPIAPRSMVEEHGRKYTFLPEASTVALSVGYNLTDIGVSLQITCQSAVRRPDGLEVVQLTVTAKGDISNSSSGTISEMLDRCHDSVILGFDDVTTEIAHRFWGKR